MTLRGEVACPRGDWRAPDTAPLAAARHANRGELAGGARSGKVGIMLSHVGGTGHPAGALPDKEGGVCGLCASGAEDHAVRHPEPRARSRVDAREHVDAMPRRVPIIAALNLLLGVHAAWAQTADTLPPIAGPPRDGERYQQRPLPHDEEPAYRGQLPPRVPSAPRGDRRRADRAPPMPPSPSAQEL